MEEAGPKFYKIPLNESVYKRDSFLLARQIIRSGYRPDFVIPIWRGGTVPFTYVTSALKRAKISHEHAPTQGYSYTDIGKQQAVAIRLIDETIAIINGELPDLNGERRIYSNLLLGDDVLDTGRTIKKFMEKITADVRHSHTVKIATVCWKPEANLTTLQPDYFVRRFYPIVEDGTEKLPWIVFPHEVDDLTDEELRIYYPDVADILLDRDQPL